MGTYIIRRLLQAIPMLLLVSIVLFALVNIAPGGPMSAYSRTNRMPEEKKEAIRRKFGLDKPLPVQYIVWLVGNDWMQIDEDGDDIPDGYGTRKGILRGDFGFSYKNSRTCIRPNCRSAAQHDLLDVLYIALHRDRRYSYWDHFSNQTIFCF